MKIALFIDANNLYIELFKKHNKKLNFQKYLDFIDDMGNIIYPLIYGHQKKNEAKKFITYLNKCGYVIKYKINEKISWDIGIAIDIIRIVNDNHIDMVVLGTNDLSFIPLINYLEQKKIKVLIIAANIKFDCESIEIPGSLLE